METIKKYLEENYPAEKFQKPFQHIHNGLLTVFAESVYRALPENMVVSDSGELVFNGPPKEGFDKFLEDSKTDLEREQLPTLSDIAKKVAESPQWKAFF